MTACQGTPLNAIGAAYIIYFPDKTCSGFDLYKINDVEGMDFEAVQVSVDDQSNDER